MDRLKNLMQAGIEMAMTEEEEETIVEVLKHLYIDPQTKVRGDVPLTEWAIENGKYHILNVLLESVDDADVLLSLLHLGCVHADPVAVMVLCGEAIPATSAWSQHVGGLPLMVGEPEAARRKELLFSEDNHSSLSELAVEALAASYSWKAPASGLGEQQEEAPSPDDPLACLAVLISAGLDVNAHDESEQTLLHLSIQHQNLSMLKLLLASGSHPDGRTPAGGIDSMTSYTTPVMTVVEADRVACEQAEWERWQTEEEEAGDCGKGEVTSSGERISTGDWQEGRLAVGACSDTAEVDGKLAATGSDASRLSDNSSVSRKSAILSCDITDHQEAACDNSKSSAVGNDGGTLTCASDTTPKLESESKEGMTLSYKVEESEFDGALHICTVRGVEHDILKGVHVTNEEDGTASELHTSTCKGSSEDKENISPSPTFEQQETEKLDTVMKESKILCEVHGTDNLEEQSVKEAAIVEDRGGKPPMEGVEPMADVQACALQFNMVDDSIEIRPNGMGGFCQMLCIKVNEKVDDITDMYTSSVNTSANESMHLTHSDAIRRKSSKTLKVSERREVYMAVEGEKATFREMFETLVLAGADVNLAYAHGSVLHCAVEALGFSEKRGPCHQSLPAYILSAPGLDPNILDSRGRTPLHLAMMNSRVTAAHQLLQLPGCDVNIEDYDGFTPTHHAIFSISDPHYSTHLLNTLLKHGADVNCGNFHKPVMVAMEMGHFQHVEHLIKNGADVNNSQWRLFFFSPSPGNQELEMLRSEIRIIFYSCPALFMPELAALLGQFHLVEMMLKAGFQHELLKPLQSFLCYRDFYDGVDRSIVAQRILRLQTLQEMSCPLSLRLYDLCRIVIRKWLGCVHLCDKIDRLEELPKAIKEFLKLELL